MQPSFAQIPSPLDDEPREDRRSEKDKTDRPFGEERRAKADMIKDGRPPGERSASDFTEREGGQSDRYGKCQQDVALSQRDCSSV